MMLSTIAKVPDRKYRGQRENFQPMLDRMVVEMQGYEAQVGREVDEVEERCAGCVVFSHDKSTGDLMVLLIRAHQGYYGFPKGHLDDGEDDISGALRETKEETGLELLREELSSEAPFCVGYCSFAKLHKDTWMKHPDYPDDEKRPKVIVYKTVVKYTAYTHNQELFAQVEEVSEAKFHKIEDALQLLANESARNELRHHMNSAFIQSKLK